MKQLTDQEKAAAKEAHEAAKTAAARRIEQAEKFLQAPLRSADGKPATREQVDAAMKQRAAELTEEFRQTHEKNERAAALIKVNEVQPSGAAGLSLTGSNVFVGLWDENLPQTNHAEFTLAMNRVLRLETTGNTQIGQHATMMAGTIASAGIVSGSKGMAFKSIVGSYDWTNDVTEMGF